MKKIFIFLFFGISSLSGLVFAQTTTTNDPTKWTEKLQYGTNEVVLTTINEMIKAEDYSLSPMLLDLFDDASNTVKINIIEFYIKEGDNPALYPKIEETLLNYEDYPVSLVSKCLDYTKRVNKGNVSPEVLESLYEMSYEKALAISTSAISVLGDIPASEDFLLDLYDGEKDVKKKASIIRSLGDMKSQKATPLIIKTVKDDSAEDDVRFASVYALGKIATPEAFEALDSTLRETPNAYLKNYIIGSLEEFDNSITEPLYLRALKDDFWQVRVTALEGVKNKSLTSALPNVEYISKNDKEASVRKKANEVLISMGQTSYLQTAISDPATSYENKREMIGELTKNYETNLGIVVGIAQTEVAKNESPSLLLRDISESAKRKAPANVDFTPLYSVLLGAKDEQVVVNAIDGIVFNKLTGFVDVLTPMISHKSSKIATAAKNAVEKLNAVQP